MQTIDLKIIFTLFVISCLWLSGCGSDNYGGDYTTEIEFTDADEDGIMTIDIAQSQCETGDLNDVTDVFETYTDTFANVTITVAEWSPGITINGYTIEYIPLPSEDGNHGTVQPPVLTSYPITAYGSNSIYIPSGSSYLFTTTCFSVDQKEEYRNLIGWSSNYTTWDSDADGIDDAFYYSWFITAGTIYSDLEISRYTIRYIFICTDDNGEGRNIEVRRTVYLGNYDNC